MDKLQKLCLVDATMTSVVLYSKTPSAVRLPVIHVDHFGRQAAYQPLVSV